MKHARHAVRARRARRPRGLRPSARCSRSGASGTSRRSATPGSSRCSPVRGSSSRRSRPASFAGDPARVAAVDRLVQERVLGERVVRVKLWARDGRVVYSDEPRLIGSPLPARRREAATCSRTGDAGRAERPRGAREPVRAGAGRASTRSTLPVRAPTARRCSSRRTSARAVARRAAHLDAVRRPRAGSLVLLWLVQVPLAWRLDRRLRRTQEEREALLVHAVEASADERRRIAAELHDGPVQDLAGLSYSLSAAAQAESSPAARGRRSTRAAAGTRDSMRQLRTLLVEIHPPNLRASRARGSSRGSPRPAPGARDRPPSSTVDPGLDLDDDDRAARLPGGGGGGPQCRAPRAGGGRLASR